MLLTPSKLPNIRADLAAYFLRGLVAPWQLVASGRGKSFGADRLQEALAWASMACAQQQNVGIDLPRDRHIVVSAPINARPAEMSIPPTHIVSAGRLWLMWRLDTPVDEATRARLADGLVRQLHGATVAREPLPLPGTVAHASAGVRLVGRYPVQCLPPLPYSYRVVDGRLARPERAAAEPDEEIAVTADKIKAAPIEWLWPGVIPLGSLSLIAGAAGFGKSTLSIAIAARVTKEGGRALIFEAEDDAASVVLPRLHAAGAEIKWCAIGSLCDLSGGIRTLTATAKKLGGVKLVVLSPIRAFFKAAEDHGNVGVRKALAPLLAWAAAERVTILGIGHPPKNGRDPFAGSQAYVEVARAAYSTVYDPTDKNPHLKSRRRVLLSAKANLGPDTGVLGYRIEGVTLPDGIETSRVVWA